MIEKKDIEQVREKTDIVELVKDSDVQLISSGSQFKGLCPFPSHDEKTPSFTVNPETNRYICYGCGVNGDAIDFVREVKGLTFIESVQYLADRLGYQITHVDGKAPKPNDAPLAEINAAARDFFSSQYNPKVTEFFQSRNLDEEYLRKEWGVGYSTPKQLLPYLREKGFSDEHIMRAGLSRYSEKNKHYFDAFRGRLMWTIYDHLNRPVGFGARKLYENDPLPGKFVNTSATDLYKKNDVLFGLDKARTGIRKDSIAILCEGYTDVVVFHMVGLPYAVASCGTSITENHVRRLTRLLGENGELVVAMDGDAAGVNSAIKLLDLISGYPITLSCILFPDKSDPEEYRRKHGDDALNAIFNERQPLVETLLSHIITQYDLTSPEETSQATIECGKVLENIHNPVLKEQYDKWLANRLQVSAQHIASSYEERRAPHRKKSEDKRGVEFDVLRMAYQRPSIFMTYLESLGENPEYFQEDEVRDAIDEMLWMDPSTDDSEWRESLEFAFPDLVGQMKRGLPFSVLETDSVANQFMNELVERLDGDMRARRAKEQMSINLFANTDDPKEIMRRLAERTRGTNS